MIKKVITNLLTICVVLSATVAGEPKSAQVISKPASLMIQPAAVVLTGPRAVRQLLVTGKYADGSIRDLTAVCEYSSDTASVASVQAGGLVQAAKNGTTKLVLRAAGLTATVPVTVKEFEVKTPVSFRQEVIAALNVGGCNAGACHGTPSGKGGFKLSLRGYDPAADYLQLTRDVLNRRTNRLKPDASLMLRKALGQVAHEGGQRFSKDSYALRMIQDWLQQGLKDDVADLPIIKHLEILPGSRILANPARTQQLAVLAHFSDGSVRDVTRLTVFSSSENAVAEVNSTGLVGFRKVGEVAILCRYLQTMQAVRLTYLEPRKDFVWTAPPESNYVDKHVFAKLKMLSIQPSDLCTDEEFIRRVYLDLCALLPAPTEVKAFLTSKEKDKRARLIDRLLERVEYADFWTLKWMDVLRGSRRALGDKGIAVYRKWLHDHLQKNTAFDQVVRELLTGNGNADEVGPANFYRVTRDPQELGESTAQLFFGIRMQCAKCHNHPFERWTQDDYFSMAAFFARVKQKTLSGKKFNPKKQEPETVFLDERGELQHPNTGKIVRPRFLGSAQPASSEKDRRAVLAGWLTAPDNPFFARSVVNRLWYHVMGRGIVDPVDDFRDSNPSANDELLDALAKDFVEHHFDVKHILRTILNSRTYQLSGRSNVSNRDDNKYFSHAVIKLLTAEQMLDALCAVTEVPEKFDKYPAGTRAVQLLDGEVNHPFLKTFGQPARELPCECERNGEANLAQAMQLINGATVHAKLTFAKNRIGRLLDKKTPSAEILSELYLATLSRLPRQSEAKRFLTFVAEATDKRSAWEDVQWTLFNSKEFMFRH
jgi:hypothetical protein